MQTNPTRLQSGLFILFLGTGVFISAGGHGLGPTGVVWIFGFAFKGVKLLWPLLMDTGILAMFLGHTKGNLQMYRNGLRLAFWSQFFPSLLNLVGIVETRDLLAIPNPLSLVSYVYIMRKIGR